MFELHSKSNVGTISLTLKSAIFVDLAVLNYAVEEGKSSYINTRRVGNKQLTVPNQVVFSAKKYLILLININLDCIIHLRSILLQSLNLLRNRMLIWI